MVIVSVYVNQRVTDRQPVAWGDDPLRPIAAMKLLFDFLVVISASVLSFAIDSGNSGRWAKSRSFSAIDAASFRPSVSIRRIYSSSGLTIRKGWGMTFTRIDSIDIRAALAGIAFESFYPRQSNRRTAGV
jgi:hypothetical protein